VPVIQVRKKSTRLKEMEASDQLGQQIFRSPPQSSTRKSRGLEQIVREVPVSSLTDDGTATPVADKPVKIRFSLGAKQDHIVAAPKSRSRHDRRKSAVEVKMESDDEELVVDEPAAPSSEPSLVLRMKLNMDSGGVGVLGSLEPQEALPRSVCIYGVFEDFNFKVLCNSLFQSAIHRNLLIWW